MANKKNHRRTGKPRTENRPASCCAGEGHNGAIGRSKWKRLSARAERRTGTSKQFRKRPVVRPQIEDGEGL